MPEKKAVTPEGIANRFGISEAAIGLGVGLTLSLIFVAISEAIFRHGTYPSTYAEDISSVIGLWIGFVGACVLTLASQKGRGGISLSTFRSTFGLWFSPKIDLPLGIAVGVGGQYLLVPLAELPLRPFVKHLSSRLSDPAMSLTSHVNGVGLVVLSVLVCVGAPIFEELFFRGLVLRGLLGHFERFGPRLGPVLSIIVTGILFGIVHFEALQLTALIAFGCVLGILAYFTRRLGPGIVAHAAFNATTIIAIARSR